MTKRPNVVVILVDDMGYSDIGCYGGEIQTPNLDALADDGIPFLQYVAFTAPHWPLHARQNTIDGWDAMRPAKYERMKAMGIIEDHWDLSARDESIPDWDSLPQDKKDAFAYRMAVYSAQVDEMDRGVGTVVQALKDTDQFDNTLILFMSDNGGCAEEIHRQGLDDWHDIGQAHTYESYGKPWANYSNTPFREYKHWMHEGGIATPLIAHWPDGIADPGRIDHQPGHLIDIMATCVELSGATYPPSPSDDVHPLMGRSLAPVFRGETIARDEIFWEHEANRALRQGKWKLVAKGAAGPWELYDMAADRTETNDLAGQHHDRVQAMAKRWDEIARATHVYPLMPELPGLRYGERARRSSWKTP